MVDLSEKYLTITMPFHKFVCPYNSLRPAYPFDNIQIKTDQCIIKILQVELL